MGRRSDSRQHLIDAANELIWSRSYGAVTIEDICERARVKKGSFYYFFDSKSDLAVASIHAWWAERKALVDQLFQPGVPPLDRVTKYIDFAIQNQIEVYEKTGRVLGCPVFTLGSEIFSQDDRILSVIQEVLSTGTRLFEQAIREAQARGEVAKGDAALKGRFLWAFYEGSLTRARIENNLDLIRNLSAEAMELIGACPKLAAVA